MTVTKSLLLNPAHSYGKQQIYMPTSLYIAASQIINAGIETEIRDLNIDDLPEDYEVYDVIGITIFGSPYVPGAIKIIDQIRRKSEAPIILGGQLVNKLPENQFKRIFGEKIIKANNNFLAEILGVSSKISDPYDTSIAPALETISKNNLERYLQNEFGFFLSQGCKHGCNFCPADKQQKEKYRSEKAILEDIVALKTAAKKLGIKDISLYLSSLDLFQSPQLLEQALSLFVDENNKTTNEVVFHLRGLSRIDSFVKAVIDYPQLRETIRAANLECIAFGLDGTTEKIWKAQHKSQKNISEADQALDLCKNLGIKPEILMVMGFSEDDFYTLLHNYIYTVVRTIQYKGISRPYLAKPFVPGNKKWRNPEEFKQQIEEIINNPTLFQNLDFAAFGSKLTHPKAYNRLISNFFYLALITTLEPFGYNTTYPILPYKKERNIFDRIYNHFTAIINHLMPADR